MLTARTCKERIGRFLQRPADGLADEALLMDLVGESFLLVEMVIELQEDLGLRLVQEDLRQVRTVGDLVRVLISKSPT